MATTYFARLARVDRFENDGALLRFEMEEPARLPTPFAPGQYLIANSGITLESGKIGKRAYSVFASDAEGGAFSLAAEKIEGGAVSQFLNRLEPGDQLQFTGPWGKFLPPSEGWPAEHPLIAVAFATGITALLGLLADPRLSSSQVIWIRDPQAPFLPDSVVKDLLPRSVSQVLIGDLHSDFTLAAAIAGAASELEPVLASQPLIYMAGEGHALDALETWLLERGQPGECIRKESFFRRNYSPA